MIPDLFLPAAGSPLAGLYNPWLVLLSVVVAIFTSTVALQMVDLAARGADWLRVATIATGSVALGCGVWAMHFIGMLAFNLCVPMSYDPLITAISMLPSLAASAVALALIARPQMSRDTLLIGGVLVGGGIGAMHYVGMAAMRMQPSLSYDPAIFGLSIIVAVVLAVLALWIRRRQLGLLPSGAVMGLAIAGMHYTGMAAARFWGDPATQQPDFHPDTFLLAMGITVTTVFIALLVAVINALLRHGDRADRQRIPHVGADRHGGGRHHLDLGRGQRAACQRHRREAVRLDRRGDDRQQRQHADARTVPVRT